MRLLAAAIAGALACAGCGSATRTTESPHPARGAAWLGLDYNSLSGVGSLKDFVSHGIAYDREGDLEPEAGALATSGSRLERGLRRSLDAGMLPDIEVDQLAAAGPCPALRGCLPIGEAAIAAYVSGFVATAQSVIRSFPGAPVVFEPMDEPWDLGTPRVSPDRRAAVAYASVLARLLPAVARARNPSIPLDRVYVPATGQLPDSTEWVPDLYQARPCLRPGPDTCGPIAGWNVHVYGLPSQRDLGIGELPGLRGEMASGMDNIIVSELGFCSLEIQGVNGCANNTPIVDGTSQQTAAWLTQTLHAALPMHRAGWLKALLVWARAGGGWSMQLRGGALTAQGGALLRFADSDGGA